MIIIATLLFAETIASSKLVTLSFMLSYKLEKLKLITELLLFTERIRQYWRINNVKSNSFILNKNMWVEG